MPAALVSTATLGLGAKKSFCSSRSAFAYFPSDRWTVPLLADQCVLLEFAKRLGLRPEWIQYPGTWKEHFDVTMTVRRKAVALGAVEVTMRDGVMASRKRWEERNDCPDRLVS